MRYLIKKKVYNKVEEIDFVNVDYIVCFIVYVYVLYRSEWNKFMEYKLINIYFSIYLDLLYWLMCLSFVMFVLLVKIVYILLLVVFFWKNIKIWESFIRIWFFFFDKMCYNIIEKF